MAKKCIICQKTKGKRGCQRYDFQLICPKCCGETRDESCEGCSYYKEGNRYQAQRRRSPALKKFMIEHNEEVDEEMYRVMDDLENGHFSKAKSMLENLNRHHSDYYMVLFGWGVFYALQKDYEKAIEYFKNTVDIFPLFVEAHYNLAAAYKNIYDVGNMLKSFRNVMELTSPGNEHYENAQRMIKVMEQSFQRENKDVTIDDFIKGQDEYDKAVSLMENEDWENAIVKLKKSIQFYPYLPQSHGNMGICYAKMGDRSKALKAFDKALEISPDYELARTNKAATEQLEENESLPGEVEITRYMWENQK